MTTWSGEGWGVRSGRWQDSSLDAVDHVISDPPFTDHVSHHAAQRVDLAARQGTWIGAPKGGLSFAGVDPAEVGPALTSRANRWLIIFCAIEQVGAYQAACPAAYVRGGWWAKTNASPQFTGDRPASPGEAIAILHNPAARKRWNGGGHKAEWRGPSETGDMRVHETQKPLWLMRALIEQFTDPGELIWDPYGGSMTTGVACIQLGRRFVGHELQDRYCDLGVERLRAAEQGLTLQAARAGQLPIKLK